MSKVVVLGGCGAVGSVAVRTLARTDDFSEVVIADIDAARGQALAAEVDPAKVGFVAVDASDSASIKSAVTGADVVLNCVGPFYKTVKTVLAAVIESGIDYVDICDDVDVTIDILEQLDAPAREAGVSALLGMGASPGATNLLAKFISDTELDETDSIDIFHCHGGEPIEGPGVIGHRFHCMSIDIPMYLDGELRYVKYFGEDGIALRETFDFPGLGPTEIFPYPHPEQVTLPDWVKVRQVTNKGSVIPMDYYKLTGELCRVGMASKESLDVGGTEVQPYDFAVAYLIKERERILAETEFGAQRGCMSVIVKGIKDGVPRELRVHMASSDSGLGEGTGIPAAIGALMMKRGQVTRKGVFPPEAGVDATQFIELAPQFISREPIGADKKAGEGSANIFIESIDADGNVSRLDL